jgi:hypothetical protein
MSEQVSFRFFLSEGRDLKLSDVHQSSELSTNAFF